MMAAPRTSMGVIEEAFAPLAGRHILDVGCGRGGLARALMKRSARVTGIDPSPDAVAAARAAVPGAVFGTGDGSALPFLAAAFDGVVFLNALHHVPAGRMGTALREAARVAGPGRRVLVIEPLAQGSFFQAMRPIEDETAVRAEAQAAVEACVAAGLFTALADETYVRTERFAGLQEFVAPIAAVDPGRRAALDAKQAEVEAAFARHAERDAAGQFLLHQPLRAQLLYVTGGG